jgi:hypothetical protein
MDWQGRSRVGRRVWCVAWPSLLQHLAGLLVCVVSDFGACLEGLRVSTGLWGLDGGRDSGGEYMSADGRLLSLHLVQSE